MLSVLPALNQLSKYTGPTAEPQRRGYCDIDT
jgi:hypothetical protein